TGTLHHVGGVLWRQLDVADRAVPDPNHLRLGSDGTELVTDRRFRLGTFRHPAVLSTHSVSQFGRTDKHLNSLSTIRMVGGPDQHRRVDAGEPTNTFHRKRVLTEGADRPRDGLEGDRVLHESGRLVLFAQDPGANP